MKDYNFKINGNDYNITINQIDESTAEVTVNGAPFNVEFEGMGKPKTQTPKISQVSPNPAATAPAARPEVAKPVAAAGPETPVKSPLPGVILEIMVNVGDTVSDGQHIMILEAMKMENNIDTTKAGTVKEIKVSKGDSVLEGDVLLIVE